MLQIEPRIRNFINDNFLYGDEEYTLANDDSFLEYGLIDSTGVLELVTFLEEEFGLALNDDELVPANLDSINKLIRFIENKMPPATHDQDSARA